MRELIKILLLKLLGLSKLKAKFVVAFGLFLATFLYIYSPYLFGNTYIKLNGSTLVLKLPISFKKCEIFVEEKIIIDEYATSIYPYYSTENLKYPGKKLQITIGSGSIIFGNIFLEDLDKYPTADSTMIFIKFKEINELYIKKVILDNKPVDLKVFYDENLKVKEKVYFFQKRIRNDISKILLIFNDSVSNYILTFFMILCFILSLNLIYNAVLFYALPSKYYVKYSLLSIIGSKLKLEGMDIEDTRIKYCIKFQNNDTWYRFLQILGPSIGFLLTTSSLIAALHPSLHATQNVTIFFESIQVAMVSTFIGLLIRLFGLLLQRLNSKMLIRLDNELYDRTNV